MRPHLTHQDLDLLFCERSARAFSKGRHKRTTDTGGYNATNRVVTCNRPINRIGQRESWVPFSLLTVAACAVLLVKSCKVAHFLRSQFNIGGGRLAGRLTAGAEQERHRRQSAADDVASDPNRRGSHTFDPPSFFSSAIPGASIPARTTKGRYCIVEIRSWRTTTNPATTPKATCEAMNHPQSIRACSIG